MAIHASGLLHLEAPKPLGDAARLATAQSLIAENQLARAEEELLKLRPSETNLPSEDPIARPPDAKKRIGELY